MAEARKQTVLVTGSSGCLGQHLVKLLHENDDTVGEIRCYDIKPYQNNLRKCYNLYNYQFCQKAEKRKKSKKVAVTKAKIAVKLLFGCLQIQIRPCTTNCPTAKREKNWLTNTYSSSLLEHKIVKEMQITTADIRNDRQLVNAMKGVDVVIHCAALVDLSPNPNKSELQSVNVDGEQEKLLNLPTIN